MTGLTLRFDCIKILKVVCLHITTVIKVDNYNAGVKILELLLYNCVRIVTLYK